MDEDRSTPGADGRQSYSDSGSYVSGETRSDDYTSGSGSGSYTGSESYTDDSYTGSEDDYTDESDDGHRGYGRQSSAPSNRISEEPWSGGDSSARGGYYRSPNIHNSMQKYHTSPDIDVASHRTITIYRNGDMHFAGRTFVVGPQFKSFDYLLDQITLRINSPWGAVRRLYRMDTGKAARKLDDIEDGETYVASKLEKYKRVDYHAIVDSHTKNRNYEAPDLSRIKYKQRAVEGRNMVEHPLTLYILANRDLDGVITKVVLKQRDRTSFKHVLDIVTQRLGYQKIQSAAQRLIDLETSDHVTDLAGLRHGAFYVAIDKMDAIRMPPFRINSARQLVPIRRKRGKVKNMPIMFDGPIRGRVDVGDKRVEQREARGIVSDIGKVRRRKGPRRLPEELPPIKQPFPRMLTIVQPPETMHYQRVKVGHSVEDRASWGIVHEYLDEITSSMVEEVLQEYQKALYMLLNNIVIMRTTAKKGNSSMSQLPPIQDTPEPGSGREPLSKARSPKRSGRASSQNDTYEHDKHIEDFLSYINEPDTDIFSARVSLSPVQKLLKERFTKAMVAAVDGKLAHWEEEPKTLVALVILLDQIPRRVYTGTVDAYAGDATAQAAINRAINDTEVIQQVEPAHMLYICIALSHQESMDEQNLWKRIWKDIERTFPKNDVDHVAKQFERNRQTIEKFGRFPERNEVLGRTNTAQEAEWLEQQRTPAAAKALERMSTDLSATESATESTRSSRKKRNWFGANRTLIRKGATSTKR